MIVAPQQPAFARPFGRTLEEAISDACDPAALAKMKECAGAKMPLGIWFPGEPKTPYEIRHEAYWELRTPLEATFRTMLQSGQVVATGFEVPVSPSSTREVINPELWRVLEPNYDESSAAGAGMTVVDILVFDPHELPGGELPHGPQANEGGDNVQELRATANSDFSVVRLGEHEFHFAQLQAALIQELHRATLTANHWLVGKVALADIGARTRSVGDLFRRQTSPHWKLLVEEHKGKYRLRHPIEVL